MLGIGSQFHDVSSTLIFKYSSDHPHAPSSIQNGKTRFHGKFKKCNLMLAVSPTCPQHKPSAYLLTTFSITSQLWIGRWLLQRQRVIL